MAKKVAGVKKNKSFWISLEKVLSLHYLGGKCPFESVPPRAFGGSRKRAFFPSLPRLRARPALAFPPPSDSVCAALGVAASDVAASGVAASDVAASGVAAVDVAASDVAASGVAASDVAAGGGTNVDAGR